LKHLTGKPLHLKIPLLGSLILILFFAGCSTQKNTFLNRNYHSITTLYNGYFNARESYRDGLRRLSNMHEDNYENVLSIFKYGSEQQMGSISGNMDVAYQKASTAIRRHSMNIRGVEYNRWIDDSYYLIARSHYFRRDFNLAVLTFEYIIRQYDSPLVYKSKIWVAKAYIQTGQFNNALQALERAARDKEEGLLDNEALLLYHMVYADYFLQQQNYLQASPHLERAVRLSRNRNQRTRLTYILAQTYHMERNYPAAQQTYARVLRLNPDFQMAFQARINMAMAFDTESGDARFILSELEGMLRDSKNREFRDQIYYALAQFSMRQRNTDKAIEYYNLALENHRGNNSQKGLTFLRLGEIYFDKKEYRQSARMYDSTMVYLSREYPDHESAGRRNVLLRELAGNLRVIEREDSLQRLAALSNADRNAILDKIIEDIQEQERIERELEQERARMRQDMARHGRSRTQMDGTSEGGWYFYNPSAMSFGRNEFYAKWGERDLEDLWRISNKRIMAFGDMGDFDMDGDERPAGGRVTRASLLENVPTTPEKMQASNARLARAYYNKGVLFKDRLIDTDASINSFETLITRFPQSEHRLHSAYFLYTLHNAASNPNRAMVYKNMIIRDFPDTDFAKILSDPNYAENVRIRQDRVKQIYKQAYEAFLAGNYENARNYAHQADTLEQSLEQAAQFSYLKALIVGKTSDTYDFVESLTYVKENFEGTNVHEPASNLLAYLGSSGLVADDDGTRRRERSRTGDTETDEMLDFLERSPFVYRPESVHFYVLVVNTRNLQIRQLRADINDFNRDKHSEDNLNLSTLFFDERRQLVTITNFPDSEKAYDYGQTLTGFLTQKEHNPEHYNAFIISVDNYPVFYQERKLEEYLQFYKIAYTFDR
jgi:tetratricopeptide (TPR) repeat protein